MSTALVVHHEIPSPSVVAIAADVVAEIDALCEEVRTRGPITPANLAQADYTLRRVATLRRKVEECRKVVKAAPLDLCRRIDFAANAEIERLRMAETDEANGIDAYNRAAEEANRAAERRRRDEEAAARAEAERKAAAEQAEIARQRKAATTHADRIAADQLEAESVAREIQAVTAPATTTTSAPLPTSDAVRKTPRKVVRVTDLAALCSTGGTVNDLQVLDPALPALRKLLLAGVKVPGAVLVDEVSISGKGFSR